MGQSRSGKIPQIEQNLHDKTKIDGQVANAQKRKHLVVKRRRRK